MPDTPFRQQRLRAWQPILTPKSVISTFFAFSAVFIPIGIVIFVTSNNIGEVSASYSDLPACSGSSLEDCCLNMGASEIDVTRIQPEANTTDPNAYVGSVKRCFVKLTTTDQESWVNNPVYFYYQLDNFYQNHRVYVRSRSDSQLRGSVSTFFESSVGGENWYAAARNLNCSAGRCREDNLQYIRSANSACEDALTTNSTLWTVDGKYAAFYPCGLIARSYFTDQFSLYESSVSVANHFDTCLDENMAKCWTGNDTAWASDQFRKFNQVTSGIEGQFNGSETCMSSSGSVAPSGYNPSGMFACWLTQMQREEGRRTNYVGRAIRERCGLFGEPECPGVDDESFIVWMRTAALPTFRKLFRRIPQGLQKSTDYIVEVTDYFDVQAFGGTKSVVLSTSSWFGGKNYFLAYAYIIVGAVCALFGLIFLIRHVAKPRPLGDVRYLTWHKKD
mmetsp:Transcript_44517/g.115736  ORF Transcript_44517/g.115736 Transcript_44517/m.115736 type:complete len:447 (-) Transcript_44517:154-1494(-)